MIKAAPPVFGQLAALADPTRSRVLLLLEQQALNVGELCAVLQLPQSTVSRHLKVLASEGWTAARSAGASRVYRLARLDATSRRIWDAVRSEVAATPAGQQDRRRLSAVLEVRRGRSAAFFSAAAGEWERVRLELFGSGTEVLPLLGLCEPTWVVGDLGCGTGQVARTLAPFVGHVIGIDSSAAMLHAAVAHASQNIEFREGALEALPVADDALDVALLFLVLHYVVDPPAALGEVRRCLKPGGRLLIVDMMPHDREDLQDTMGHVWPGFSGEQLAGWLTDLELQGFRYTPLPVDARAKGPALFAARAVKSNGVNA